MIFFKREPNRVRLVLITSFIFLCCASYFSSGFHHFDEHFQVIEFLNFKLGNIHANDLAWEFKEQIRPWTQIYFYLGIYKIFAFLNLNHPITMIFIFRFINVLLGFYAFLRLRPLLRRWFPDEQDYLLATMFLHFSWYVPYFLARTSSESLGTSVFLIGVSFYNEHRLFKLFFSGLLLSCAYLIRTQFAVMVAGFWFHLVFSNHFKKKRELVMLTLGITTGICFGPLIDYFGYGQWTFVPWNYVNANLFKGYMLQVGGVQPWYYYLIEGSKKALGPLCLFFVLFPLVFILKNPKHVLTAIFLPLFLLHSYIFHKEFRFIFPLLPLVSLMAALVFLNPTPFFKNIIKHKVFRVLVIISLVINFAAYLFVCFRPANSSHKFYAFMFNHPEVKSFYAVSETPYKMLGLKLAFYTPKVMTVTEIKSFSEIKDKDFFVFFNHANEAMNYVDNPHCKMFYSSYPNWFYKYNYTNWISRTRAWTMLHCNFAE